MSYLLLFVLFSLFGVQDREETSIEEFLNYLPDKDYSLINVINVENRDPASRKNKSTLKFMEDFGFGRCLPDAYLTAAVIDVHSSSHQLDGYEGFRSIKTRNGKEKKIYERHEEKQTMFLILFKDIQPEQKMVREIIVKGKTFYRLKLTSEMYVIASSVEVVREIKDVFLGQCLGFQDIKENGELLDLLRSDYTVFHFSNVARYSKQRNKFLEKLELDSDFHTQPVWTAAIFLDREKYTTIRINKFDSEEAAKKKEEMEKQRLAYQIRKAINKGEKADIGTKTGLQNRIEINGTMVTTTQEIYQEDRKLLMESIKQ